MIISITILLASSWLHLWPTILIHSWLFQVIKTAPKGRYKGIKRNYEVEDVLKLRGSIDIECVFWGGGGYFDWFDHSVRSVDQLHIGHPWGEQTLAIAPHRAVHRRVGCADGKPSGANGPCWAKGHLFIGWAHKIFGWIL